MRRRASNVSEIAERSLQEYDGRETTKIPKLNQQEAVEQEEAEQENQFLFQELASISQNPQSVSNFESQIVNASLGTFLYPVADIGDTREQFIYRKINFFYLERMEISILNNLNGKFFRPDIIVKKNPKVRELEKNVEKEKKLLKEKLRACHKHPNKSIFYSAVRSETFESISAPK